MSSSSRSNVSADGCSPRFSSLNALMAEIRAAALPELRAMSYRISIISSSVSSATQKHLNRDTTRLVNGVLGAARAIPLEGENQVGALVKHVELRRMPVRLPLPRQSAGNARSGMPSPRATVAAI